MKQLVKQTKNKRFDYPEEFEWIWQRRPKRSGPDNKKQAYKAFNARLKEGYTAQEMAKGMLCYGRWCVQHGVIGTQGVKMLATFLGPDHHFLDDFSIVAKTTTQDVRQVPIEKAATDTSWAYAPSVFEHREEKVINPIDTSWAEQ